MKSRLILPLLGLAACTLPQPALAQERPLQIDEFVGLDRVSDPQVSPDGQWVIYAVTVTDIEANGSSTDLWIVPVGGGEPRQIDARRGSRHGRWSPDGGTIAYITTRDGTPQIRLYTVASRRTRRLTVLSTGADGVVWSPTGTHLAFVSEVYVDYRLEEVCSIGGGSHFLEIHDITAWPPD